MIEICCWFFLSSSEATGAHGHYYFLLIYTFTAFQFHLVMHEVSEHIQNFGEGKSALVHISNCEVQV